MYMYIMYTYVYNTYICANESCHHMLLLYIYTIILLSWSLFLFICQAGNLQSTLCILLMQFMDHSLEEQLPQLPQRNPALLRKDAHGPKGLQKRWIGKAQ